MNRSAGHRYRTRFALFLWIAMIWLFMIMPSSSYFVHNPNARFIAGAMLLLTISFTLLTLAFWLMDHNRSRKRAAGK